MEDRIRARIDELTRTRDALVESANRQVAAFNGGIEALRGLLEAEAELPAEADKSEPTEPPAEKSQPAES